MGLATKRKHYRRLQKARKDYWWDGDKTPKHLGMVTSTTNNCSNPICCGNPRRTFGRECRTAQEEKAITYLKNWRKEHGC